MESTAAGQVQIKVLFFAKAKELVESGECAMFVNSTLTVDELKEAIFRAYPVLMQISSYIILAVNQEYCSDGSALLNLKFGDEVAIIPPLSGG